MELGLHIANFTWPGGAPQLAPTLARIATTTEDAGFTAITVMDHLWQIGVIGPPEDEMLEAYTTLGFLAAHTKRVRAAHARHRRHVPLARTARQGGHDARRAVGRPRRARHRRGVERRGIAGLGLHFPPTAERFERLEETLQICLQMWSGSDAPFEAQHYQLGRTLNSPASLSRRDRGS